MFKWEFSNFKFYCLKSLKGQEEAVKMAGLKED